MQKIRMVRGLNDKFYFVEKDSSGTYDIIYAVHLEIREEKQCWEWKKYPVYETSSGRIVSLEIDPFATED